jgi:peptidoglycan hydrolase-like protein with peptidoglycan-binding domain
MDEMVLKAQKWVNATYASVPGYVACPEDGHTGWPVAYSLTRALQRELGITELSDNFGPTTLRLLTLYGEVGPDRLNINMRTIVEAGLYCKGYSGGNIDGSFGDDTQAGLAAMCSDMGVATDPSATSISPKQLKGLLTMDAYVLLNGGDTIVRQIQRWLNANYWQRQDFFIGPCDGYFSRDVQRSLVLAIQYTIGMADGVANGNVGPGTRAGLQNYAYLLEGNYDPGPTGFVRLFKAALHFNGWDGHWNNGSGIFLDDTLFTVRRFQEFAKLPVTGAGDYQTWMSLLLSTGDPDRIGTAIDVMYPLNSTTVQTVKNAGYRYVGRYLTGGTNKVLTNSEIALILDNGLSFFPLYQEWGNAVEYFSYDQGLEAGRLAKTAAESFGIPYGSVIYFSVDFDAIDDEITSAIVPHFQGVNDATSSYAVGVYGCRNVCIRLTSAGLATRSFVSGMSTGYSGNLGFPLPENWAFDQISNFQLDGGLEIDNDLVSGRDLGVDSVTRARDANDAFYTYLIWLEARAGQWRDQGHTDLSVAEFVAQYLRYRSHKYKFLGADQTFGVLYTGFIDFVNGYQGRPDVTPLRDPHTFRDSDVEHFGASFGAVLNHDLDGDRTIVGLMDLGGWGGDLISALGDFANSGLPDDQAYGFAIEHIASYADAGFFTFADFLADVDAMVFGLKCKTDPSLMLSTLFRQYYATSTGSVVRFGEFVSLRFGSRDNMLAAAANMFSQITDLDLLLYREGLWRRDFGDNFPAIELVPDAVRADVARAFTDRVMNYA